MTDLCVKHLISRARVFHVGFLDRSQKRANSHEGSGLSVSLHPEAWRRIAPLGDAPTYILRRRTARFIDVDRALNDALLMHHVWNWATNNGYILAGERFEVRYRDTEYEETRTLACSTYDEAVAEAEDLDGVVIVKPGYLSTMAMTIRAGHTHLPIAFVNDFALAFWAEDCCPRVDGLWWNDRLAPERLSAPRGVIFNNRLTVWHRTAHRPKLSYVRRYVC